jgi:UDP-N-acetylmuramoyl-L-alanyl-D-glutamate--2,6-diaminopimelate ligase
MTNMKLLRYKARKVNHFFRSFLFKALPASFVYLFPGKRLKVYGITGTDGKTTSSTLLYHVLKTAGYKVALISTVAAFIGDEEIDTGFHVTSPEPWQIQKLLKRCLDAGIEHVVLEVTSHGIFQYRIWGIDFVYAGITNVTNEHLDYFVDFQHYLEAKTELLLKAKKGAFLNEDDLSFPLLKVQFIKANKKFLTYSQMLRKDVVGKALKTRFPEEYNRWNGQLVAAMAEKIGVASEVIAQAFETFPGVRGRMEQIPDKKGRIIIVDFAHTPNALERALHSLRPQTAGSVFAVFGCAGLRDTRKRPAMGGIAGRLSDFTIFTAEDPRTEDIELIFRQMKEGVGPKDHGKVVTQPDRRSAIKLALQKAKKGDVIGIFGKGHEKSLAFGKTEYPWSDQDAVRELLAEGV